MFFSRVASFAALSALVGSVAAEFSVLSPGGPNLWWVAQSQNTLVWSCTDNPPATTFQVLLANTNVDILVAPSAIISTVNNADCSHTITQQQTNLIPATNYTIILADIVNQTHVYATSQPFEVKALGASYPPASATPSDSGSSASASATASGSASGSTASSTSSASSSQSSSGAEGLRASVGAGVLALVGAAFGLF